MSDKKKDLKMNDFNNFSNNIEMQKSEIIMPDINLMTNKYQKEDLGYYSGNSSNNKITGNSINLNRSSSKQPKQSKIVASTTAKPEEFNKNLVSNINNYNSGTVPFISDKLKGQKEYPQNKTTLNESKAIPTSTKNKPVKLVDYLSKENHNKMPSINSNLMQNTLINSSNNHDLKNFTSYGLNSKSPQKNSSKVGHLTGNKDSQNNMIGSHNNFSSISNLNKVASNNQISINKRDYNSLGNGTSNFSLTSERFNKQTVNPLSTKNFSGHRPEGFNKENYNSEMGSKKKNEDSGTNFFSSGSSKDQENIHSKIVNSVNNEDHKENISASLYRQQLKDNELNQRPPTENKVSRPARFEEHKPTSTQNRSVSSSSKFSQNNIGNLSNQSTGFGNLNNHSKFENQLQQKIFPKSIYNSKQSGDTLSSSITSYNPSYNSNSNLNSINRTTRSFGLGNNFGTDGKRSVSVKQPESIDLMSLINSNHPPANLNVLNLNYSNYEASKYSFKKCQSINAYAANTHQGCVRGYNEDRVSIILNITKPTNFRGSYWPKCSFFAVYDGHGGAGCADYLRDNLHQHIVKDSNFPQSPKEAIIKGCQAAEDEFTKKYALTTSGLDIIDRSGSCAVFVLFVDDMCYVGNVGDSRAIMSKNEGKIISALTRDHKPNDEIESKRIYSNGGRVYQTQTSAGMFSAIGMNGLGINSNLTSRFGLNSNQILSGPSRVFPGRLSVSRTFGDIEAKLPKFGGIPNVLTSIPDIISFKISDENDFLFLGCDGIYDLFENEELVNAIFMVFPEKNKGKEQSVHFMCGRSVDMIMKTALSRNSIDNITSVLIAFNGYENKLKNIYNKSEKENYESNDKEQEAEKEVEGNHRKSSSKSNLDKSEKENLKEKKEKDKENKKSKSDAVNSITTSNFHGTQEEINSKMLKHEKSLRQKEKILSSINPLGVNENKFRQINIDKAYKSIYSTSASNSLSYMDSIDSKGSSNNLTTANFTSNLKKNK